MVQYKCDLYICWQKALTVFPGTVKAFFLLVLAACGALSRPDQFIRDLFPVFHIQSGTEAEAHIDARTGVAQIDSGRPSVGSVVETRTPERQPTAPIKWPFPYKNAAVLLAALFTFVLFLPRLPIDELFIVPDLAAQVVD